MRTLGGLGLPWGLVDQVDLEGPRRRSLSCSGKFLVGLVDLASLHLLVLGVLVGLGWQVLVVHVALVGLEDPVSQYHGQRGLQRWSCCHCCHCCRC